MTASRGLGRCEESLALSSEEGLRRWWGTVREPVFKADRAFDGAGGAQGSQTLAGCVAKCLIDVNLSAEKGKQRSRTTLYEIR